MKDISLPQEDSGDAVFFFKVLIDYKEEFSVYTKYATDFVNKFVNKFLLSNLSNVDL